MKNTLALAGLILLMLLAPADAGEPAAKMYEIEPGWRVGLVVFTMSMPEVQAIYGDGEVFSVPDKERERMLKMLQYKNIGLDFIFSGSQGQQLEEVSITYPLYSVKGIVKVGSGIDRVKEVMGDNFMQKNFQHSFQTNLPDSSMIYDGITFFMKNDRVVRIAVRRKR